MSCWLDLRPKNLTGRKPRPSGRRHMTCNKNGIPNDPQSRWSPAASAWVRRPADDRGFGAEEVRLTANLIADVLDNPHDEANIAAVRAKVTALTAAFPVYR